MNFNNKVAIVTGAGQGIGFEICRQLSEAGAQVILNDLDKELSNAAANSIENSTGGKCISMPGDAGDLAFINQMVETSIRLFGKIDIAIANAGITLYGDFFTYPADHFFKVLQVNLGGSFFLAQAASNKMKNQPSGGSILFTSSVTAHQAHKNLAVYGMSKAAIEMLAKNLVIEVSEFGINVNAIAPGATLTERTLNDAAYESVWSKITPMGRPANVMDIAATALFLVSENARHITGQTIVVDGGWTSISPSPY